MTVQEKARELYEAAKGPRATPWDRIGNMAQASWLGLARKQVTA